jgi:hypothetical protein
LDARYGNAGRFADTGVPVMLRCLERGDGIARLLAKIPQANGGAAANVAFLVLEGLGQRWHNPGGVAFPLGQHANRNYPISLHGRIQIDNQFLRRLIPTTAGDRQHA